MKANLISVLTVLLSNLLLAHAGHKAYFTFEKQGNQIEMTSKMEIDDIKLELDREGVKYESLAQGITKYISQKVNCKLNGVPLKFELISSINQKGYVILALKSQELKQFNGLFEITNLCFREYNHSYENIVRLFIENTDVTYKMTNQRSTITHRLD